MCWGCAGGLCHFFVFSLICRRHFKKEVTPAAFGFRFSGGEGRGRLRANSPQPLATYQNTPKMEKGERRRLEVLPYCGSESVFQTNPGLCAAL